MSFLNYSEAVAAIRESVSSLNETVTENESPAEPERPPEDIVPTVDLERARGDLAELQPDIRSSRSMLAHGDARSFMGETTPQTEEIDWSDPQAVLEEFHKDPDSLQNADPALLADHDFALELLRLSRNISDTFPYFDESLQTDPIFLEEAVDIFPGVVFEMDATLPNYSELLSQAIAANPNLIIRVPPNHSNYSELAQSAVRANPLLIRHIDTAVENYAELAEMVVRDQPHLLGSLDPSLQQDPSFVIAALTTGEGTFAILEDHRLMRHLEPEVQQEVWDHTITLLAEQGHAIPEEWEISYENFTETLAEAGIEYSHRIRSLENILTLLDNHQNIEELGEDRPIAVVVASPHDYNSAFTTYPTVDTLIEEGFDVLYYEVDHETGMEGIADIAAETGQPIHTLVLEGHGTRQTLALGPDEHRVGTDEESFIDVGDFDQGDFDFLDDAIDAEGNVMLISCSTGRGEADEDNLANRFAELLPGRRIYSPTVDTNVGSLSVNEDYSLNIEWQDGPDTLYIAQQ